MSKEEFNLEVRAEKGEGLSVRGKSFDKGIPLNLSLRIINLTNSVVIVESQGM